MWGRYGCLVVMPPGHIILRFKTIAQHELLRPGIARVGPFHASGMMGSQRTVRHACGGRNPDTDGSLSAGPTPLRGRDAIARG
ncbi:hypothetical protein CBM2623_U90006 [Cupriavidus taiwanensis]|nr:hypothetical protein CBM2623_U90006 [Cupriavidus taiwanensis]